MSLKMRISKDGYFTRFVKLILHVVQLQERIRKENVRCRKGSRVINCFQVPLIKLYI